MAVSGDSKRRVPSHLCSCDPPPPSPAGARPLSLSPSSSPPPSCSSTDSQAWGPSSDSLTLDFQHYLPADASLRPRQTTPVAPPPQSSPGARSRRNSIPHPLLPQGPSVPGSWALTVLDSAHLLGPLPNFGGLVLSPLPPPGHPLSPGHTPQRPPASSLPPFAPYPAARVISPARVALGTCPRAMKTQVQAKFHSGFIQGKVCRAGPITPPGWNHPRPLNRDRVVLHPLHGAQAAVKGANCFSLFF